jgi:hypothetical protein
MANWRSVLPPEAMLDVRYEDVVDDLERAGPPAARLLRPALELRLPFRSSAVNKFEGETKYN